MQNKYHKTARFVAIKTLCQLYQHRLPVKQILSRYAEECALSPKERSLAMQLVYGVLRQRQYLDRIIRILSKTPLRKLNTFVHQALAIGLFQIFFLTRIPESAAVNEVVNSCKTAKIPKRLHGFVNAVLRQSIRQKDTLTHRAQTDAKGRPVLNHPDWLVRKWQNSFGTKECERICRNNNYEPPLVLRINTRRISPDDFPPMLEKNSIAHKQGYYGEHAVILPDFHAPISSIPGYNEGFFQVQSEAAQLATKLLCPFTPGGTYLDGCAGLGGKTSHLIELGQGSNLHIHAVEPEKHRLTLLQENLTRLHHKKQVAVHRGTLQDFFTNNPLTFDGILLDAPCSGTGVTGRHPDIRWNRRADELIVYQAAQLSLLQLAAERVRPGGIIVYATCSLEPEENIEVINIFLASHQNFTVTDCSLQIPRRARKFIENNFFAPRPSATMDGFFAARLQRC